jgi:hypothetical protein
MPQAQAQTIRGAARERRRERRPVAMRGYIIPYGGVSHAIELVDLNYGGCGIRTPIPLAPGQRVKINVVDRGSMPAEVRWYRAGRAGIDFSPSEEPREHLKRKAPRILLKAEAILRAANRPSYRVAVHDISTEGCQVEFVDRPREGDRVWVKFFGLDALDAKVAWVERSTAGLNFVNVIHPAVFDLLLERLEVA